MGEENNEVNLGDFGGELHVALLLSEHKDGEEG